MRPNIPETNKKAGVSYAVTDDGLELPVIDVTHPAFAVQLSEAELDEILQKHLQAVKDQARTPAFVRRLYIRLMQRRSILMRGIAASAGTFLSGINTYILKLGADNLNAGYASQIDRQIAASLPALAARLRLQDTARLLAEGLAPPLLGSTQAALHLLNIGGGPAIDSLNALIVLGKEHPGLLAGRRIFIHSLDLDDAGPAFGARALDSLLAQGAALQGLDITFHSTKYNWSDPTALRELAGSFERNNDIAAVSSEGALFEYGSDEEITANLQALHEVMPAGSVAVGSVTRADEVGRLLNGASPAAINLRGLEAFTALALSSGWRVVKVIDRPISHDVLMKKV